jgi:Glycosyltransferase
MKKILMISTCNFLMNHNDGGKQGSYKNYTVLCQIFGKKNVFLCLITNDAVKKENGIITVPSYRNIAEQIVFALGLRNGYNKKTEDKIVEYINNHDFDYVWLDRSTLGRVCLRIPGNIKTIVFFHNIEKKYIINKIKHDNVGYLISYPAFYENEKQAVKFADKILCLNNRDSQCLKKLYGREADAFLPVSFEDSVVLKGHVIKQSGDLKLLFVGSYFAPNIQGISWFIERVMSRLPNIVLTIIGKDMEKKAKEWNRKNIYVAGTVDDLGKYYQEADAVILPILFGDGMKVKTAEALMYGKVIFGTKEALVGYDIEGQPDIFECNTDEEFIEAIRKFSEKKREDSISWSNRNLFLDKYENQTIVQQMTKFFDSFDA